MMTAHTVTIDPGTREAQPATRRTPVFSGDLYLFHGFTVLDSEGQQVGIVDWIWTNDATGEGDHVGLHLQWLRGKARAVPAAGARVDRDHATVRVPYTKQQIASAPRFRIDRSLTADHRAAIATHFVPAPVEEGSRATPTPFVTRSRAARGRSILETRTDAA